MNACRTFKTHTRSPRQGSQSERQQGPGSHLDLQTERTGKRRASYSRGFPGFQVQEHLDASEGRRRLLFEASGSEFSPQASFQQLLEPLCVNGRLT